MEAKSACPECNHMNATLANFCSNCGCSLEFSAVKKTRSDLFIIITLSVLAGTTAFWFLLDFIAEYAGYRIYDNLYYLNKLVDLLFIAVPFLLIPAISNKSMRIAGLVMAILFSGIRIYWFIDRIISDYSFEFYDF